MISNNLLKLQLEVSVTFLNKVSLFVDGNYRGLVLNISLRCKGVWFVVEFGNIGIVVNI